MLTICYFLIWACCLSVNAFVRTIPSPTTNSRYYSNDAKPRSRTQLRYLQSSGWQSSVSRQLESSDAIAELIKQVEIPLDDESPAQYVAFLFVSQFHSYNFADIVEQVYQRLDEKVMMISLIGGGVVGENEEFDESAPVISMLWGALPEGAKATGFFDGPKQSMTALFPPPPRTKSGAIRQNSRIVFADPWFDVEESILDNSDHRNDIVIGGISCPSAFADEVRPTVAMNGTALPQGSAAGISFWGSFGIQSIVSQGCRSLGPIFTITSAAGNTLRELDGVSALTQLERVASNATIAEQMLMERNGLLCGIGEKKDDDDNSTNKDPNLLIREITGLQELKVNSTGLGGGALTLGVKDIQVGDKFQFQVRDGAAAQEDMETKMRRAKVERLFAGQSAGMPVAAIQITCLSRCRTLFGSPNVNLNLIQQELLGGSEDEATSSKLKGAAVPVGGFFGKGQFGPLGISGFGPTSVSSSSSSPSEDDRNTHMQTFTTIVGLLCDYSSAPELEEEDLPDDEETIEFSSEEEWG